MPACRLTRAVLVRPVPSRLTLAKLRRQPSTRHFASASQTERRTEHPEAISRSFSALTVSRIVERGSSASISPSAASPPKLLRCISPISAASPPKLRDHSATASPSRSSNIASAAPSLATSPHAPPIANSPLS